METRRSFLTYWRFFLIVAVLPMTLFTALGMDCYSRFSEEEIGINRFWGFGERTYSYVQVRHIVQTTHVKPPFFGETRQETRLSIVFNDGRTWCNANTGRSSFEDDLKVIEFVCRKTGKPLTKAKLIEDVIE